MLVVLTEQRNECTKECSTVKLPPSNCCVLNCCLKKIKVMNASESRSEINPEHFAYSFLNSVKNETKWTYPIMSAVSTCFSATAVGREKLMADETLWGCEGKVPNYFYELVDCAYARNL
jgi:phosphoheptose isomerase